MNVKLPVSPEILRRVAQLDHFRGVWAGGSGLPAERLTQLREAARVQSVAASCRIAGIRVSDAEVGVLLSGGAVPVREGREVLGYAEALGRPFPARGPLLSTEEIRALHGVAMGAAGNPPPPGEWRREPYHLEFFDAEGRAVGRVLQTLPPRLLADKMEDIVTWLEPALRGKENHPVLIISTFMLLFIAASPFPRGNGRMAHLLTQQLLRRAGYDYMPYASFERVLEEMRWEYYEALDAAETRLWAGEADLVPWVTFFLNALEKHCERVRSKIDLERRALEFTPLQRKILETVREHGTVGASLFMEATGSNRNTLKDNLRRLVDRGVLERLGERRGARYRLVTGGSSPPAMGGPGASAPPKQPG